MNISTKRILASCAVLLSTLGSTATAADGITFLFENGKTASFAFSSKPVVDTSGDEIVVSVSSGNSVSYAFADVSKFYFEGSVVEGIAQTQVDASASAPVFAYANGTLSVSGLNAAETIVVFSTAGETLTKVDADGEGRAHVDLSTLPTGVYVVSTQRGVSFKLFKK